MRTLVDPTKLVEPAAEDGGEVHFAYELTILPQLYDSVTVFTEDGLCIW